MLLRDAILHSKETGCEFWRDTQPWHRLKFSHGYTHGVRSSFDYRKFEDEQVLATDWVCSDGWKP